jgi:hypothetical protein
MLKYEWMSNSAKRIGTGRQNRTSGRTDDLGFEGFAIVQGGLRTNDRRWLRERHSVDVAGKGKNKSKYRLHGLRALLRLLLLGLGRTEEATKEARLFLLGVNFEVLVVIQLRGGHLSGFGLGGRGFVRIQAIRHDRHGLRRRKKDQQRK